MTMINPKTIRELRKEAGLTQEQLASKIGLTKQMICLYETGKEVPTQSKLELMAKVFDIIPSLFYDEPENNKAKSDELLNEVRSNNEYLKKQLDAANQNIEFLKGIINSKMFQEAPVNFPMESSVDTPVRAMYEKGSTFQKVAFN